MNSGGYIPRRVASRYISCHCSSTLRGIIVFSIPQISWIKSEFIVSIAEKHLRLAPNLARDAKLVISSDIPRYRSQSERAKIAIHWFGEY